MAGRKTDAQILDEVLAEQGKASYVDPVRSAKQALAKANAFESSVNDDIRMSDQRAVNARNTIRPSTGMERMRGGIDSVLDSLEAFRKPHEAVNPEARSLAEAGGLAAVPAAFMSGVPGAAAAGYYALQGLYDATDPNSSMLEKGASLAPAMIPVMGKAVRTARGLGDEVAAVARPSRGFKSPSGMPVVPRGSASAISHNEMPVTSSIDEALAPRRFTRQTPEVLDAGESVAAPGFSLGQMPSSLAEVPSSRRVQGIDRLNQMTEEAVAPYRSAEYATRQTHGVGGFSRLPEMSLGELSRMARNIDKISGR